VECYIWCSDEGTGRGRSPPKPLLAAPNVTANPSSASAPITVLLYNSPLLYSFNVPVKGLNTVSVTVTNSGRQQRQMLAQISAKAKTSRGVIFHGGAYISWFDLQTCSKVIEDGAIGQNTYDFLLVLYSNFGRNSHRFCATVDFMPK